MMYRDVCGKCYTIEHPDGTWRCKGELGGSGMAFPAHYTRCFLSRCPGRAATQAELALQEVPVLPQIPVTLEETPEVVISLAASPEPKPKTTPMCKNCGEKEVRSEKSLHCSKLCRVRWARRAYVDRNKHKQRRTTTHDTCDTVDGNDKLRQGIA